MDQTLEFLNKLNWVLKPIADVVIFLFTTSTGYLVLLATLLVVMIMSVLNEFKIRQLAYSAAKIPGTANIPFHEKVFISGRVITRIFLGIFTNLPVFLGIFVFLLFITGFSKGITGIDNYFQNQMKIKELTSILKQLDQRYKVAEIKIEDFNYVSNETRMNIRFFDYAKQGFVNETQNITIKGSDIYFDAVVLNFEYSEITTGANKNIVLPYRVFSELVPQENGIALSFKDENGLPFIFKRKDNEVYGMSPDRYNQRLKEIMEYLTDTEKARQAGIRSVYGNAVHKKVKTGDLLTIWVEQTGGLVIKETRDF
jgi:hypothetical protein